MHLYESCAAVRYGMKATLITVNGDTELFKLTEQTSIIGKLMFCNIYCSIDLIIIDTDM